jgi:hypothetical protein
VSTYDAIMGWGRGRTAQRIRGCFKMGVIYFYFQNFLLLSPVCVGGRSEGREGYSNVGREGWEDDVGMMWMMWITRMMHGE